ncbi:MAG: 5-formyltetrahydrofolate cyclo-ligase, partial [Hyphomicrobiales bacterium]
VAQGFGTFAPGPEAAVLDPLIMLVPMAAFDAQCHRMGYGRGFYDRAIESLRAKGIKPMLAGLAFAVQEVAAVPVEAHDVGLDLVATERELHRRPAEDGH